MCEDTNNHVYKLATDNLQLVLIKVLITSIKVSQGSECSDVFNVWCDL